MKLLHLLESPENPNYNNSVVLLSGTKRNVNFKIKYVIKKFERGLFKDMIYTLGKDTDIKYKMSIIFHMRPSDDMNYSVYNMSHNTFNEVALFAEKPDKLETILPIITSQLIKLKVKTIDELDRFLANLDADNGQLVDLRGNRYFIR